MEIVRDGNVLLVFPEGRPSPDGEIGPHQARHRRTRPAGRPVVVRPLAIAYDPFVRGRTRVHLAHGPPAQLPKDDVEGALLALLRLAMPLTCGQVVAALLEDGAEAQVPALEGELADAVASAREEGRPVEPDLETPDGRRRRLAEALAVAPRRARELPFLAREYASARSARPQPDSWAGSRRLPRRRGKAGLTSTAPMIVTGRTASACIVNTYAVALSGLTSMPLAASRVR